MEFLKLASATIWLVLLVNADYELVKKFCIWRYLMVIVSAFAFAYFLNQYIHTLIK